MPLPIESVIPDIIESLRGSERLILQAPPGAGKTTVVPLKLLNEPWLEENRIILLEPRRLAAITSARRMAQTLGESVGETVGYRVRLDSKVSAKTRIEVVTEGIFLRMIQNDPELNGIGAVLFDEFHERSLQADLALALAVDAQEGLREDLKLLIMSATLDGDRIGSALNAPVVSSEGRTFQVELCWEPPRENERMVEHTVRIVKRTLRTHEGSILVFLPGMGEIRRAAEILRESDLPENCSVAPLYGSLSRREQDLAINPVPEGERKIVLATNIAETSLTIEGITVVVDSGVAREPRFNPGSGMTGLVTAPISQASAKQRAGRAGRTAPGVCYRLWSEQNHAGRLPFQRPEILTAELSSFRLELAVWGCSAEDLFWLDPPPSGSFSEAGVLLQKLGALDEHGRITADGGIMSGLGVHPRLAKMILTGAQYGAKQNAADLAALLSERDVLRFGHGYEQTGIALRLDAIARFRRGRDLPRNADRNGIKQIVALADSWKGKVTESSCSEPLSPGGVIASGFPDRVGLRRKGQEYRYLLSGGNGTHLPDGDPLSRSEMIVAPVCAAREKDAKIFLAAEITKDEVARLFEQELEPRNEIFWESREKRVIARDVVRLGSLIFSEKRSDHIDPGSVASAVIEGIRELGITSLPWTKEAQSLIARLRFLYTHFPEDWGDMSDSSLLETLEDWLEPFLAGITRADQFGKIDLVAALKAPLSWEKQQELDRLAPERITVPEGSKMKIDYSENPPVLAVKLQMMFGAVETPAVGGGRVPLLIHLLSPAGRPVQITQDLQGFWDGSYDAVKKDMKGRYPKHPWPDNPREAVATARTKRGMERK